MLHGSEYPRRMANLTITVDDATLKRARIRALERGESVNSYLADVLAAYADAPSQAEILYEFGELVDGLEATSGPGVRTWTRDDLHR